MATGRSDDRYGRVAVALHWTIAILIVANVLIGWFFPHQVPPGMRFAPKPLLPLHISLGLLVLGLSLFRLGWRIGHRAPPFAAAMPRWERALAHAGHWAFYALIVAMPMSGWLILSAHKVHNTSLSIFGIVPWPHVPGFTRLAEATVHRLHDQFVEVHSVLTLWLFPALLALHVGAVAKHHLFDADPVLKRMLPRWGPAR